MRILVTGASGFVGRALCRTLVADRHDVHALSRDPERLSLDGELDMRAFVGSIADPQEVATAAKGCEAVIHAAGIARARCPERVARWVHVAGTENVLQAARHAGCRRVVHLSCADVTLHDGDRLHWDEARTLPRTPTGTHALSKLMAEELALSASDASLEVTALRPAWLWGPGDYDGVSYLHTLAGRAGMPLMGGGRHLMATTHIDNLTRAAQLALTAEAAPGHAYHLTDGEFSEAKEFFGQLTRALGLPPPRTGSNLPFQLWKARLRQRLGLSGMVPAEVLQLGRGALFDLSGATRDLDYRPEVDQGQAMQALAAWVVRCGGLEAVLQKARPLPQARDVDAQVALAGGD